MSKVTIAIPFYNAEKYLELSIQSVLSQTFQDFQLLLIDDGSTDSSLEIANRFSYDKRIKIFSDGKNLNLGFRLNQIPYLTDTEFLARMDADDIMHPNRIEKQLQILQSMPEIDVLATNVYSIDENNKVFGKRLDIKPNYLLSSHFFIHPTIMAKTSWFKQNPYDVDAIRVEDTELWLSKKNNTNFKILGEPLLFYREIGTHYYKKYLAGLPGIFYMLKKHNFSFPFLKFSFRYFLATIIYFFADIFNKEYILIKRRNKVQLQKRNYDNFLNS